MYVFEGKTRDLNQAFVFLDHPWNRREGIPKAHNNPDVDYFQYGYGSWPNPETLSKASFSLMAVAEMARRHFVSLTCVRNNLSF
jgi:hypothetical protein